MPMGFREKGNVMKLLKNIYGFHQSPRTFWKSLTKNMEYYGIHHTQLDPFLFVGEKLIFICCLDDLILWSQNYS